MPSRIILPKQHTFTPEEKQTYKQNLYRRVNPTSSYRADMIIINRLKNNADYIADYNNNTYYVGKVYKILITRRQYTSIYSYYKSSIINNNIIIEYRNIKYSCKFGLIHEINDINYAYTVYITTIGRTNNS